MRSRPRHRGHRPAVAPLPTALPILTSGATPVIVEVLPGSLAMDPDDLQRVISTRTRAAITVPLWGYPVDTSSAQTVLAQAGIPLIEDAAQAHGTGIGGRYAGTIGTIGCFSTHDRKLLSTGEGGFILSDDPGLYERVEHYTRLGHLRGTSHGVNYKLAAPLAAIGTHRPPDSVRYGYRPLYRQPLFARYARTCPQAERLTTTTFQMPVHPGLTPAQLEWVSRRVATLAQPESEQPS